MSDLTGWSFGYIALLSFWTVFLAELVGDKSIYSIASLSIRYSAAAVFSGITLAFAGKMLVAVLLVRLLVRLHFWTDMISAVAFSFRRYFSGSKSRSRASRWTSKKALGEKAWRCVLPRSFSPSGVTRARWRSQR